MPYSVIPAQAGIQSLLHPARNWSPFLARPGGFSGVTNFRKPIKKKLTFLLLEIPTRGG